MSRPALLLVLATFVLAACTGGSDESEPSASPNPQPAPTEQISLYDLGIADWPRASAARFPEPPERPAGVTADDYELMVSAVRTWATQAATAPETVGSGLPRGLVQTIEQAADDETESALAKATVLDPDLQLINTRMTGAWALSDDEDSVNLSLQTRTAYEVRTPDGPVRVIGVLRTQGVIAGGDLRPDEWGSITGWQEFGAADCAIVLDGHLTPGGDPDDQLDDLEIFVKVGEGDDPDMPPLAEDDEVDEDFQRTCAAGRV